MGTLFFEDFEAGQVYEYGHQEVSQEDIIRYARQYDPQYFHTDPEEAKESMFDGLIASGWHTCSLFAHMFVTEMMGKESGALTSPGFDELGWEQPVRPGDTLRVRTEVTSTRLSESREDRGLVYFEHSVFNQNDRVVLRLRGPYFYSRRSFQNEVCDMP